MMMMISMAVEYYHKTPDCVRLVDWPLLWTSPT